MRVSHVLKDGSRPTDITGHIVRAEDVSPLYQLIHSINTERGKAHERKDYNHAVRC
jgi:hypothetical protein